MDTGVYLIQVSVNNGVSSDIDEVYIISSDTNNLPPKVSIYDPLDGQTFLETDTLTISANASDLNGVVKRVDFYVDSTFISSDTSVPFQSEWMPHAPGKYSLTAIAFDNDSASAVSYPVGVIIDAAPPCRDSSSNKEFLYEFSPAKNNPTLTFIPTLSGMGSPTCILYYGTSPSGPLPGYFVTPNVPFQINAAQGSTIYFYYTYSYPGQGQHNNSAQMDSYKIGSCSIITTIEELSSSKRVNYYPNPTSNNLYIEDIEHFEELKIYDYNGKLVEDKIIHSRNLTYDTTPLKKGLYLVQLHGKRQSTSFKFVKQ